MATFVVSATTATFGATIRGAAQEAGDLERLTVGVNMVDAAAWTTLQSLVTTKYAVQVPLGGNVIVDWSRGAGPGTLTIVSLGVATALLVSLTRNRYDIRGGARTMGTAQFLIQTPWA